MLRVHFIGIGGIGVSALARAFLALGYAVSGSDGAPSPLLDELRREGIKISEEDYQKRLEPVTDAREKEWMLKNKESILYDILNDKVFDVLIASAKIEEIEV